jgi:phosphoribosylaminoimidazolecarboxamide formyltransferase/IMP cyclohydrolase
MFKNALVSVSDKTGLLDFLKPLVDSGLNIYSTGGTAQYLRDSQFPVTDVSDLTGFPEVMDGRVKTLHPKVHMGLLARSFKPEDFGLLESQQVPAFDLVIVNLYPFEKSRSLGLKGQDLIEKIDIGGPSMLRSAAKSFERITVLCDPQDYVWVAQKKSLSKEDRQKLAAKVFSHTATYDSLISSTLNPDFQSYFSLPGRLVQELRYGENPHQKAAWYSELGAEMGLHEAQQLQGKELSYNNILDLDAALRLLLELKEPACVAVKHNNPCGVALGSEAIGRCLKADPISVFGGIVATNILVDGAAAEELSSLFLECVIAPDFTEEAKSFLAKKKNLRLLIWPRLQTPFVQPLTKEVKSVLGGFLVQDLDQVHQSLENWKVIGETPRAEILRDLVLAEKIAKSLKSNSISIVSQGSSLGLGMGQTNRVDSVELALRRAAQFHPQSHDWVLASDAFFPFPDSMERLATTPVKWVLQPGGSLKDGEVIQKARAFGITMILTGERHFKH